MKPTTIEVAFSVHRETWNTGTFSIKQPAMTAYWLKQGKLTRNHQTVEQGTGIYATPQTELSVATTCEVVRFSIQRESIAAANPLCCSSVEVLNKSCRVTAGDRLFRLDRVDFPPNAVAWRHTHPGPGIRYSIAGALTIHSDHGSQHFREGEAWFEDVNSPVQATADSTIQSGFVRMMLLPTEYFGQSTFHLADEADAHKPRLQTNVRYVDELITL